MQHNRLFMLQVVVVIEQQWFAPYTTDPPIRISRCYKIEQQLYAAQDEDAAYKLATLWLENQAFNDADHDGEGDLRKFYALGIHQLEEVTPLNEFGEKTHEMYGVFLSDFCLAEVDQEGVPVVRSKEELEIFRLQRIFQRKQS